MKRLEEANAIRDFEEILEGRFCARCFAYQGRRCPAAFMVRAAPDPGQPNPLTLLPYCEACLFVAYPPRLLAAGLIHGMIEAIHETSKDDLH